MNLFILITFSLTVSASDALSSPYGSTAKNVATQILQGAGPATVDMNQYNLPSLEQIEEEWTVNLVQKAAEKEVAVQMRAKNNRDIFAETVSVSFPRQKGEGLGIELKELAGGRSDGLGITIVTGLVSGGAAEGCDILPGDVISKISVVRRKSGVDDTDDSFTENEEVFSVRTEGLSYDSTVDAILTLPPQGDTCDNWYDLTLKRLRRKPKVKVNLRYPPSQDEPDAMVEMFAGENLRQGLLIRGVKLNDPLAQRFDNKSGGNCGAGGLCRTCAVSVLNGKDILNPQRVAEKQMLEDVPRWRLACKAIVGYGMKEGEITIRVNPRQ